MGFLDFLKKSKEDKNQAITLGNQEVTNSKEANDVKIPLPDKTPTAEDDLSMLEPEKEGLDTTSLSTNMLNDQKIAEIPTTQEREMLNTNEKITAEKLPKESATNKKPEAENSKVDETNDSLDFSLPDFSEDDFKIGELSEDLNKEKKEDASIKKSEVKNIHVSPPLKSSSDTISNKNNYLEMNNCKKVFDNIYNIQKIIETNKNNIVKQENLNRSELQQYKQVHDNLDIVQEKLMEIDNTLFEG